ncbi:hypothetical protein FRC08_004596 [Ceratobasidium sp. 394]|nr:hypothetical protein FRC08_004596 [Ceratobasidium sp. 394]
MAAVATHEIPDTSKRANEVEKLFCIMGSHFNRWEKDPSILPDIPYFDRAILYNRNRFVPSRPVPQVVPCFGTGIRLVPDASVDTSDLASPCSAVEHKSVAAESPLEPATIDPRPAPRAYASVAVETPIPSGNPHDTQAAPRSRLEPFVLIAHPKIRPSDRVITSQGNPKNYCSK